MLKKRFPKLTINLEAGEYFDNFLVSAVFSVFAIRTFLSITGYPQLGGEGLHIAHMLWGGLLMLIAIIFLLAHLTRKVRFISSIIGGLGFGIFIDELGKFITQDNNYFFRPTIALVYLIFLILFFVFRRIRNNIVPSKNDYLINSLEFLKEAVIQDMDIKEKTRVLTYLEKCDQKDILVKRLKRIIKSVSAKETNENIFSQLKRVLRDKYFSAIRRKKSFKILVTIFVFATFINLLSTLQTIKILQNTLDFWDLGQLITAAIIVFVVLGGLYYQRRKDLLKTYNLFKFAVMVDIFLGQFFLFYREGLSSYFRLLINITIFFTLQYAISQEKIESENIYIKSS